MAGDDVEQTRTHRSTDPIGPAAPLQTWGEFKIIGELGRGAFGRVYHAWDATLARDIALKIIRLPDATAAAAALTEGRMLARVRHRNVVTVYGAQQSGDEVAFWMELIQGRHLGEVVRVNGPMSADEATVVGISLCQALAAVHAAGLIHRDVKANNVMRESGGRIVLMDFGTGRETARAADADFAGTPVYMAPEVIGGGEASAASDLYSLGVLLFFIVTGDYPVPGRSLLDLVVAHRRGHRQLLGDRRPDLPDGFVRVVERALATKPAERPASAGAMMRDLADALPGAGSWETRVAQALSRSGSAFTPETLAGREPGTPGHAPGPSALTRWTAALMLAVAGVGLCGFLMSVAFNQSLQREGGFSTDRFYDWWIYGARSLVAPWIYAAILIMIARVGGTIGRGLIRALPARSRLAGRLAAAIAPIQRWTGTLTGESVAQWLVVLHLASLVVIWWQFYALLNAVIDVNGSPAHIMEALDPDNVQNLTYRPAVTVLLLLMIAAWHALLRRTPLARSIDVPTRLAGAALVLVTLLLLEVPYRLLYQNDGRRVTFNGSRCYQVGSSEFEVLLYCPDSPPRIHIVGARDPALVPTGVTESIFTSAAPLR